MCSVCVIAGLKPVQGYWDHRAQRSIPASYQCWLLKEQSVSYQQTGFFFPIFSYPLSICSEGVNTHLANVIWAHKESLFSLHIWMRWEINFPISCLMHVLPKNIVIFLVKFWKQGWSPIVMSDLIGEIKGPYLKKKLRSVLDLVSSVSYSCCNSGV